jgi:hypothetical protein
MKNAVPVPTSAGRRRNPDPERCLSRGSEDVGTQHHAPPAESVARDTADEQEDNEGDRLGCQHRADVGRRPMP